ncbi:translocation protein SEC63 homolog [Watersipora subatra]|uniref:translocation protein SEC63 homolog n=1 Tax=Watersipora subatra TaxID=2589382 RepID=UPI00355BE223
MAGMNFQYDETGGTFYYFLVSFYALALIPFTLWVWRRSDSKDARDKDKNVCHCEPCQAKTRRLHSSKPKQRVLQKILCLVVIVGWVTFIYAAYLVAQIQTDHVEYDPYEVLGIDRGATDKQIKSQYRELSRTHHPDKSGGDDTMFLRIAKAHAALTDPVSKKNWEEYGNPDGPGAMQFGIALPKWLVEGNTSVWVLMSYVVVFMIILPSVVGTWWYKSIKYSGDKILLPTTELYYVLINKTPNMVFKRAFMILASSLEFWKIYNPEVVERPTDDEEVRRLMRDVHSTYLNEKNREKPLCLPYSIKARALLLAHMQRIPLPQNTLQQDVLYILGKTPTLINEMVHICAQLTAMSKAGHAAKPRLQTIENIMKMGPLLVQGLWENSSPLLMLPHIAEQQLKHFVHKKRPIRNLKQFSQLEDKDRRALVRHLEDPEYRNIITTLRNMPAVSMVCDMKVLDDEDNSITAGAIVTVLVTLTRESLFEKYGSDTTSIDWSAEPEHAHDAVEAEEEETEEVEEVEEEKKKPTKVWEKQKGKKSKGGKKKKPAAAVPYKPKSKTAATSNGGAAEDKKPNGDVKKDESTLETVGRSDEDTDAEQDSDQEQAESAQEDDDWEEFEAESKKHAKLEATSLESHSVHCPFFTNDKQEYWWLYLCDKKKSDLITVPVRVTNLVTKQEIDVKFPAPKKPGVYTYTMCLKSDSFLDMDIIQNLKFDVKEAKEIKNHPQWDISDDEDDKGSDSNANDYSDNSDSEYEYDED